MNQLSKPNQTVLITGASSGIGLDFAHIFAKEGFDLVLVARSGDKLEHLAQELFNKYAINCSIIVSDLTKLGAAKEIFAKTQAMGKKIHVLINNAGFGILGIFNEIEGKTQSEMIQVNISALTELTHCYLNDMLNTGGGKILNVASTAAFQPGPFMSVYYATKAYVLSFSEALANELKGTNVQVSVLCPGPTLTGFQSTAKIGDSSKIFNTKIAANSYTVAQAGYDGLMNKEVIIIPGIVNKLGACSSKLLPRTFVTNVTRWLQEKKN